MLDARLIEELRTVFSPLEKPVVLRLSRSEHAKQGELEELLRDLTLASPLLSVEQTDKPTDVPQFELIYEGQPTGISFRGVPGGHEFSSLVLSILYCNGKGKRPDEGMLRRIQSLKGPIRLKTYVSLSCENCPEVVQALNLMAALHGAFEHEMVDGALSENEITALGIQAVPAVIADGKLIHAGKAHLGELLAKLEERFGSSENPAERKSAFGKFDVAVIGGGPAGVSAAIYSARKGLSTVLVAERLGGQLRETRGIENMISIPYTEGAQLAAGLAKHVASYPIQVLEHRRVREIVAGTDKWIHLESGESLSAAAVIIATGAKWRELGIPGEREHIGAGVAFCAHCDGPFYKGKRVAVIGGGNSGVEAAIDLAGTASDVVLLEYAENLKADRILVHSLNALPNARILTAVKPIRILGDGKKVTGLEFVDRTTEKAQVLELDGVFVQIGLQPHSHFVKGLVETNSMGEILVDAKGRTNISGIYAAGDVTPLPFKQIVTAMGDGAKAALTAFEDRIRTRAGALS